MLEMSCFMVKVKLLFQESTYRVALSARYALGTSCQSCLMRLPLTRSEDSSFLSLSGFISACSNSWNCFHLILSFCFHFAQLTLCNIQMLSLCNSLPVYFWGLVLGKLFDSSPAQVAFVQSRVLWRQVLTLDSRVLHPVFLLGKCCWLLPPSWAAGLRHGCCAWLSLVQLCTAALTFGSVTETWQSHHIC